MMNKTINYILSITLLLGFIACDEEVTNPIFGEQDMPMIHVKWQDQMALNIGDTIKYEPQISPSDGAVYEWLLNDEVISTEKNLNYPVEIQGELTLKFKVVRNEVENSRTSNLIVVKPFVPKEYNKKMIGYISRNGSTADIQWDQITHLMISSAIVDIVEGVENPLDTNFVDANFDLATLVSTAHNYGVFVLLDVTGKIDYVNGAGPWGELGFYNTVIDAVKSQKLIDDLLLFVSNNEIDGINLYLNNTSMGGSFDDPEAVNAFFNAFADALPEFSVNGKFIFTASVPGGWTTGALSMVASIERFDWYNLMAFGSANIVPAHHAPYWGYTGLADIWIGFGVPAEKLVMAVPAIGVHYTFPDGEQITWGNSWKYTFWKSYSEILTIDPDAETKNKIEQDKGIFYDGHADIDAKAQYVLDNGLGGVALWSLESDSKDAAKSLTKRANDALGN